MAWLVLGLCGLCAADDPVQVRIAWGGAGERRWEGTISLDGGGELAEPRPLGIEADEPGSMWVEQGQLMIRQRSPRAYDGVDLWVAAAANARLVVQLIPADNPNQPVQVEVPLAELVAQPFDKVLDPQGNRLLVRRTPGDQLRVELEGDSLVFAPGDVFRCTIKPHPLPADAEGKLHLKTQLVLAGTTRELWSAQYDVTAGRTPTIPLELTLPEQEGIYDLIVTATPPANWQEALRRPLRWKEAPVERKVQLLVLGDRPPAPPAANGELRQVGEEIDPTSPGWRDRLAKLPQLSKVPRLWKGPIGNGQMKIRQHPLGRLVELSPSNESPDLSWEAYPLPISQPDRPHVLEVEYPSDAVQTLGISILEANASGALMPIGLDSGVYTAEEPVSTTAPHWVRHRLIFWPRTAAPLVLMANCRDRTPAVYHKLRVLAGWNHLPRALGASAEPKQRLLAAYLDRPLFPENFSAREAFDPSIGRGVDDWRTFHDGGTRLVEYLHHVGYNGLVIAVLADGSTIYPSAVLEPTPRYDTGVFFATAQDPVRKDVLEMLLRLFDREGLQLVPQIEFATPLPELEALKRRGGAAAEGLELIGPDGAAWCQAHPPRRGLAPYYNPLHPAVQDAMLAVVREVVGRYGHHTSFAGLAIRLSAHGYAQLPGPEWAIDDLTIARFQQDVKLQVPATGEERFAQRAALLAGPQQRTWLVWRAAELGKFYRRAQAELSSVRPDGRLYLTGAAALSGPELEADLRPALPRRMTVADALLQVGLDARLYQDHAGPVLLRPERIVPGANLGDQAVNLELGQMADIDECFRNLAMPGSLFFHPPQELRVESFDQKGPFRPSFTQLYAQHVPSERQNRRRFVHSLATLDCQVMIDGGWMLPLGQEDSIRDLVAAYRSLPAVRFQRVGERQEINVSQPVAVYTTTHAGRTFVYLVNDAPLRTTARISLDAAADCRLTELTGLREVPGLKRENGGTTWTVDLQPYDLVAVQLSQPKVKLSRPQVELPGAVETALSQRIRELAVRVASLRNSPPPWKVLDNPGFERSAAGEGDPVPGWSVSQQAGVTIAPDKTQKYSGSQSVKLSTTGPWACLVSQPFGPPSTGRLTVSVFVRVADAARQPALRIALGGKLDGREYYQCAEVGRASVPGRAAQPIGKDWTWYRIPFSDLPLEGLNQLQVRFDLAGPGEAWIDDVQLFDLKFEDAEVLELSKLVSLAQVTLRNGQVGDCLRLLEGYWPRFLEEHVPLEARPIAASPPTPAGPKPDRQATAPPQRTGLMDRMKNLLPKPLKF